MSPAPERTIDRIAHAFSPQEWSGRSLVIVVTAFAVLAVLTVVQRALVADSTAAWVITGIHAAVVASAVPAISWGAVRRWRAAQPPTGVPE